MIKGNLSGTETIRREELTQKLIKLYVDEKKKFLERFPFEGIIELVEVIWKAYLNDNTVYACGNGGNAAYVANMLTDLSMHPFVSEDKHKSLPIDVKRLRTVNLVESPAALTAILNDIGPATIFSQQLINHGVRKGDVLFGFSGSGNSGNVVKAFQTAKEYGAITIAITREDGGKLKKIADITVIITGKSKFPGQTGGNNFNFHYEDTLSVIAHMITGVIKKRISEEYL